MGYRIVYGKDKRRFFRQYKALLIIVAICLALWAFSHFTGGIRLPEAALENMVDTVRSGETLSDAITAFCREIIQDAEGYY